MKVEVLVERKGQMAAPIGTFFWDAVPRIGEELFFEGKMHIVERVQWEKDTPHPYLFVK